MELVSGNMKKEGAGHAPNFKIQFIPPIILQLGAFSSL
jgi:hypothetical protein